MARVDIPTLRARRLRQTNFNSELDHFITIFNTLLKRFPVVRYLVEKLKIVTGFLLVRASFEERKTSQKGGKQLSMSQEASQDSGSFEERKISQKGGKQLGMSQEASQDSGSDGVDSFSEKYDFQYVDAFLELFPNELRGYDIKIEKLLKEGRFKEAFPLHEHSCALFSKAEEEHIQDRCDTG
ncbi:hypothetical protein SUGI_0114680 [Cryptomeria japonica]|nr:hypothetical protein SUGI_0114680 [Cryptomeria japonica]